MEQISYCWRLNMSKNIDQVYTDNPTNTLPGVNGQSGDCLIYIAIDPFGSGDDSAILASDLGASFMQPMNNLNDVNNVQSARLNLQVPSLSSGSGNPNTVVAGEVGDIYMDTGASNILYYCITAGDASTAIWQILPIVPGSGNNSVKLGFTNSTVNGVGAFAMGNMAFADSDYSFAFGDNATSFGIGSVAIGYNNGANGAYSFCFGDSGGTISDNSFAFGTSVVTGSFASAPYSFAFGNQSQTGGLHAFAFGFNNLAAGDYSWAIGNQVQLTFDGCVGWSDLNSWNHTFTADNQFKLGFSGGYFFYDSNFKVATTGFGLQVAEGSNAKQGTITLSSGVGVVSNTSVTANSRIFYCGQDTNVTGFLTITARTAGSGFTITSSQATDSGVVAYEIFEPA